MGTVQVRVYEELNEFLPPGKRKRTFDQKFALNATVEQLLGVLGVPASQVDLVLADDVSVDLNHVISDGERISIFPVFERFDVSCVTKLRAMALRETRFLLDCSLQPLAVHLRRLGFDAETSEQPVLDSRTLHRADDEKRILLTNSNEQSRVSGISRILVLNEKKTGAQLREVLFRLDLYRTTARRLWDVTPEEAKGIQRQLRDAVVTSDEVCDARLIGGVDVAYDENDKTARAAVAVFSFPELELSESASVTVPLRFPYIPGLLSFRETPAVLEAIARLRRLPDLLLCDGQGLAHPRRFGMACHVGVLSGIPSIGIAKTLLTGSHGELPMERGAWVPLVDSDEMIGAVVRTRAETKPVYVSVGTGISLNTAIEYVLRCSRYRLPEPLRWADRLSKQKKQ